MYAGRIAETGPVVDIFHRPQHPYTAGLLASLPRLDRPDRELTPIGGTPPRLRHEPVGCPFAPRCRYMTDACLESEPDLRRSGESLAACVVLPFAAAEAAVEGSA
jgi:oligopeptide/dipeptide ABC transporter ATP-binding protein